jgi:AbrB family transcriptional regulator (stage V sporulation protein T)
MGRENIEYRVGNPADNMVVKSMSLEGNEMKATGIVRRIDDLGRIVIPKEIRRTLRIREGDALEIFTDAQGGVIFKKYSPVGELSTFASQYAEVLNRIAGLSMVICDRDHVVAAAGVPRKEYLERRVTPELEECVQTRRTFVDSSGEKLIPVEGIDRPAEIVCPILASSDVTGSVVVFHSEDSDAVSTEDGMKLAQVAAAFLGKQMEE